MSPRQHVDVDGRMIDLLTRTQRLLARSLSEAFAEEDVAFDQWRILCALDTQGQPDIEEFEPPTMGRLADDVQVPAASLSRLVDALVDRALVYRRPAADDGRKVTVHLSDLGSERLARLDAIAAARLGALAAAGNGTVLTDLHRQLVQLRPVLDTVEPLLDTARS